jgi:23S rRNA pseudouridine1911/1915/1917 synthase
LSAEVPAESKGARLDKVLASLFPDYSRGRLQTWLKAGAISVDGKRDRRPRDKVRGGEQVTVEVIAEPETAWQAEPIALNVVYQDEQLLVVDKPAGLVVHPAAGNYCGTLVNALLHHAPELEAVPRAGLIHRIDKDTTGLLVVARTLEAHTHLTRQLKERAFLREYRAIAYGAMTGGGSADAPLGRHPQDRKRMAVVNSGREAVTHYRIAQRFSAHTYLSLRLETGRTHQIRVHMAHIHHPLVGDPVYGGRRRFSAGAGEGLRTVLAGFRRQALHAARLGLKHPGSGEWMEWTADMPEDMQVLLAALREQEDN